MMNKRRGFIAGLALGAVSLPTLVLAKSKEKLAGKHLAGLTLPPTQGRGGAYFPNVVVRNHLGKTFQLYSDMAGGKVVLVNFMTIKGAEKFPVTQHLAQVADKLGTKLGRSVFIYSITTDPEQDTPQRLRAHAKAYGALRPGWQFIHAAPDAVQAVSERLYKHHDHGGSGVGHPARLVHYGNPSVGLWAAFGTDSDPTFAAERVSWLVPGRVSTGIPGRAGPSRIGKQAKGHNRLA